ncbi:MAG: amino acid ABC transporter permease [Acetobacteraceae bacterium]
MNLPEVVAVLAAGGVVTLRVAAGAWIVGAVAGLLFALVARARFVAVRVLVDLVTTCLRGVPQLVLLYLVFFGIGAKIPGIGPITAAILGLGLAEAGFNAEVYRGGFLTVGQGQRNAAASLGLSRWQTLRLVVLPIAMRFVLPALVNSFVGLLKLATLASAVGAPEILYRSTTLINEHLHIVGISLVLVALYLVFTLPLTRAVARLEGQLRGESASETGYEQA